MTQERASREPLVIIILQGNDGRYTYCPKDAIDILKPRWQPGQFDTVAQAARAACADKTIPTGTRIEVDPSAMGPF